MIDVLGERWLCIWGGGGMASQGKKKKIIFILKVSFYFHVYKKFNIIWAISITGNVMNINNYELQTNVCLSVC